MATDDSYRVLIERVLARPVTDAMKAGWGFTNRTDFVTLDSGDRVVLQRYRSRRDARYRLQVMHALRAPAAEAGIAIPRILQSGLDRDPAWMVHMKLRWSEAGISPREHARGLPATSTDSWMASPQVQTPFLGDTPS